MTDKTGLSDGLDQDSTEAQDDVLVQRERRLAALRHMAKALRLLAEGANAAYIALIYVQGENGPRVYIGGDVDERMADAVRELFGEKDG